MSSLRLRSAALALVLASATAAVIAVVTASPASAAGTLTVSVLGRGDVTSPNVSCSESGGLGCSHFYPNVTEEVCDEELTPPCHDISVPQEVELTAGPDRNGYVFAGFTGCDATLGRTCLVTMDNSRSITASFTDITAPQVSLSAPADGSFQRGDLTLAASASDNSGAVTMVEFRVKGVVVSTDTTAPYGTSVDTTQFDDGAATVTAKAFDSHGNAHLIGRSITIDNTVPTLGVSGPDGQTFAGGTTQTWALTPADPTSGVASTTCAVAPIGTTPTMGACTSSTTHSVTDQPDGSYTFTAKTTDNAGNTTTVARSFTIDSTGPDTSITSGPANGSRGKSRSVTFGLAATEPGTMACRLYAPGTTPPVFASCSTSTSHTASGLADGTYTFEVRATDAVGNTDAAPAVRTFTVDATRPTTSIVTKPAGVVRTAKKRVNARFAFAASEPGTFRCSLDGKAFKPCAAKVTFRVRRGTHVLLVRAVDRAGNPDATAARYRWKVKPKS